MGSKMRVLADYQHGFNLRGPTMNESPTVAAASEPAGESAPLSHSKPSVGDLGRFYDLVQPAALNVFKVAGGQKGGGSAPAWNKPGFKHGLDPMGAVGKLAKGDNVAIAISEGYVGLDPDGPEAVTGFEALLGDVETLSTRTPNGGAHFYFQLPEGVKLKQGVKLQDFDSDVDIRTAGKGCLVAPGSHLSGAYLDKEEKPHPDESGGPWYYHPGLLVPIAMIPDCILEKLPREEDEPDTAKAGSAQPNVAMTSIQLTGGKVPAGQRNEAAAEWAGTIIASTLVRSEAFKTFRRLCQAHTEGPLPEDEIKTIFDSIWKADMASNPRRIRYARGYFPESNSVRRDLANRFRALGIDVRWNTRERCEEYRTSHVSNHPLITDGEWHAVEVHRSTLISMLEERCATMPFVGTKGRIGGMKHYPVTKEKFDTHFQALALESPVDPFLEYLEQLDQWDGTQRIAGFLGECFAVPAGNAASVAARSGLLTTMLGAVARAHEPGRKHDTVCVLKGSQGGGKSTFWSELAGRDRWFSDGINFGAQTKELVESLLGNVLVECSELTGLRKADSENLKAFLSRSVDKVRPAYGRNREDYPRTSILVASTNSDTPLPGKMGELQRRWIVVPTEPLKETRYAQASHVRETVRANRGQLWAEALAAYRLGMDSAVGGEDEAALDAYTGKFRDSQDGLEELVSGFLLTKLGSAQPGTEGVSLLEISQSIDERNPDKFTGEIRHILGALGWVMRRVRINGQQRRRWFAPDVETPTAPPPSPPPPSPPKPEPPPVVNGYDHEGRAFQELPSNRNSDEVKPGEPYHWKTPTAEDPHGDDIPF